MEYKLHGYRGKVCIYTYSSLVPRTVPGIQDILTEWVNWTKDDNYFNPSLLYFPSSSSVCGFIYHAASVFRNIKSNSTPRLAEYIQIPQS